MVMKRKIYQDLLKWKVQKGESALLVKGARRTGKSYIVEEFGNDYFRRSAAMPEGESCTQIPGGGRQV
jgi:hypothetical protein